VRATGSSAVASEQGHQDGAGPLGCPRPCRSQGSLAEGPRHRSLDGVLETSAAGSRPPLCRPCPWDIRCRRPLGLHQHPQRPSQQPRRPPLTPQRPSQQPRRPPLTPQRPSQQPRRPPLTPQRPSQQPRRPPPCLRPPHWRPPPPNESPRLPPLQPPPAAPLPPSPPSPPRGSLPQPSSPLPRRQGLCLALSRPQGSFLWVLLCYFLLSLPLLVFVAFLVAARAPLPRAPAPDGLPRHDLLLRPAMGSVRRQPGTLRHTGAWSRRDPGCCIGRVGVASLARAAVPGLRSQLPGGSPWALGGGCEGAWRWDRRGVRPLGARLAPALCWLCGLCRRCGSPTAARRLRRRGTRRGSISRFFLVFLEVSVVVFLFQGYLVSGTEALARTAIISGAVAGADTILKASAMSGGTVLLCLQVWTADLPSVARAPSTLGGSQQVLVRSPPSRKPALDPAKQGLCSPGSPAARSALTPCPQQALLIFRFHVALFIPGRRAWATGACGASGPCTTSWPRSCMPPSWRCRSPDTGTASQVRPGLQPWGARHLGARLRMGGGALLSVDVRRGCLPLHRCCLRLLAVLRDDVLFLK